MSLLSSTRDAFQNGHSRHSRSARRRQGARRPSSRNLLHWLEHLENRLAPALLLGSTFEIDGNLKVNTTGDLDWANAPNFNGSGGTTAGFGIGVDSTDSKLDNS